MFRRSTSFIIVFTLVIISIYFMADAALAQGEHARRAGAEIQVLLGDARRLQQMKLPQKHRKGLRDRIRGELSDLEILLRLANQGKRMTLADISVAVKELRSSFIDNDLSGFIQRAKKIAVVYPLLSFVSGSVHRAQTLHAQLCAGCHDQPYLDMERPALNLFQQARIQSVVEFLARLIIGVRGDQLTGYGNPLTEAEIAGLADYYRTGSQP